MNKSELVSAIAKELSCTKSVVDEVLNQFFEVVSEELSSGGEVKLPHVIFKVKTRAERNGKNPKTGANIVIPKAIVPTIKATKRLKDAVAETKKNKK